MASLPLTLASSLLHHKYASSEVRRKLRRASQIRNIHIFSSSVYARHESAASVLSPCLVEPAVSLLLSS